MINLLGDAGADGALSFFVQHIGRNAHIVQKNRYCSDRFGIVLLITKDKLPNTVNKFIILIDHTSAAQYFDHRSVGIF